MSRFNQISIIDFLKKHLIIKIIWIESILKDEALIEKNIRAVKINYPDYNGVDPYEVLILLRPI